MEEKRKWLGKESGNKSTLFAHAIMWIAVAIAVTLGMFATKSSFCLLAFLIPANLELKCIDNSESDDD